MLTKPRLSFLIAAFAVAGCQHQEAAAPPSMQPPPTVTSSPLPPPEAPPPSHAMTAVHNDAVSHIYKLDFVFTPRDPKDGASFTAFSISSSEGQEAEVSIGKNVPLQVMPSPPTASEKGPPAMHSGGVPRQDVGFKVKAHVRPVTNGDDVVVFVDFELSAADAAGNPNGVVTIRKMTAHGAALAALGKSAPVLSIDDDKRHYDLAVTVAKLR